MLMKDLRAALQDEGKQKPVEWLSRDDARLALWEAINKRKFGNPTDDKLILEHLRQHGLWIGKYTAPPHRPLLTDEEICAAANSVRWSTQYHIDFGRTIERKVRGEEE